MPAARPARTGRGCRRCSSASSPRSWRAGACRPTRRRCCRRDDVERIAGDAIGAPIPSGRYAVDPEVVGEAAAAAISAGRARPHLPAGADHAAARDRDVRARGARVRARARGGACAVVGALLGVGRGARSDRALQAIADAAAEPIARTRRPRSRATPTCPQRFLIARPAAHPRRSRSPSGRSDRRARIAATCSTGSSSASTTSGTGPGPARARAGAPRSGCGRSPSEECDAAEQRGRDRLSGDVGGRPGRGDRRLPAAGSSVEREDPLTATLPLARARRGSGQRDPGEQRGALSQDEPIEIELGGRARCRCAGRIDRINWDASRRRASG